MSVKKLYQDLILDHSTNPRNNKELDFLIEMRKRSINCVEIEATCLSN